MADRGVRRRPRRGRIRPVAGLVLVREPSLGNRAARRRHRSRAAVGRPRMGPCRLAHGAGRPGGRRRRRDDDRGAGREQHRGHQRRGGRSDLRRLDRAHGGDRRTDRRGDGLPRGRAPGPAQQDPVGAGRGRAGAVVRPGARRSGPRGRKRRARHRAVERRPRTGRGGSSAAADRAIDRRARPVQRCGAADRAVRRGGSGRSDVSPRRGRRCRSGGRHRTGRPRRRGTGPTARVRRNLPRGAACRPRRR